MKCILEILVKLKYSKIVYFYKIYHWIKLGNLRIYFKTNNLIINISEIISYFYEYIRC